MFDEEILKDAIFSWEELHGKVLEIFVGQHGGVLCVMGRDVTTKRVYVIHNQFVESKVK